MISRCFGGIKSVHRLNVCILSVPATAWRAYVAVWKLLCVLLCAPMGFICCGMSALEKVSGFPGWVQTRYKPGFVPRSSLVSSRQIRGQISKSLVQCRLVQDKPKTRPSPVRCKPRQDKPRFCTWVLVGLIKGDFRSHLQVRPMCT